MSAEKPVRLVRMSTLDEAESFIEANGGPPKSRLRSPKPKKKTPKKSPKKSPKKKATRSSPRRKANAKPQRKSKPTYLKMVDTAIRELGNVRSGHSVVAICKYIEAKYPVPAGKFQAKVWRTLKSETEKNRYRRVRNSFKFHPSFLAAMARKARAQARDKAKARSNSPSASPSPIKSKSKKKKGSRASSRSRGRSKRAKALSFDGPEPDLGDVDVPEDVEEGGEGEVTAWQWQYHDGARGGWLNYYPEANEILEETYQQFLRDKGQWDVRAVKSGEWSYQVDFRRWKQMNVEHDAHTERDIRRVPRAEA